MFVCEKCGAWIDKGGTEWDCPYGCFDKEKQDHTDRLIKRGDENTTPY